MSFGGPIDSMINAHKSNLRLLRGRKRLKEIEEHHPSKSRTPIDIKGADEFHQRKFKERIRQFRRAEGYRTLLIVLITIILLMIILLWVVTADFSGVIDAMTHSHSLNTLFAISAGG